MTRDNPEHFLSAHCTPELQGRVKKERAKEDLIRIVMEEMEKREFTVGEAEMFPGRLKEALQRNSERFEKEKPFAIYKFKN